MTKKINRKILTWIDGTLVIYFCVDGQNYATLTTNFVPKTIAEAKEFQSIVFNESVCITKEDSITEIKPDLKLLGNEETCRQVND